VTVVSRTHLSVTLYVYSLSWYPVTKQWKLSIILYSVRVLNVPVGKYIHISAVVECWIHCCRRLGGCLNMAASTRPLDVIQNVSCYRRALSPGVKLQGNEIDLWPPSSAEVKNEWSCNCFSSVCFHDVDRNKFTLFRQSASFVLMSDLRSFLFLSIPTPMYFTSHDIKRTHDSSFLIIFIVHAPRLCGLIAEFFGVKLTTSGGLWRPSCVGSVLRHPVISQIRTGASWYSCVHLAWWTVHSSSRSLEVMKEEGTASAFSLDFRQLDTYRKSPS
jgi:hypothetical protein